MINCPKCGRRTAEGRFCEQCGAELPTGAAIPQSAVPHGDGGRVDAPPMPVAPPAPPVAPVVQPIRPASAGAMAVPTLEMDTFCILFEGLTGFLRFRFNPGTTAENVSILLENPLTGAKVESRKMQFLQGLREITVPLPGQDAGAFVWYLTLTYEAAGRKRRMEGEVQMVVVRPREAQKAADQLTVTITNNITNGNASDVHVSQQAVEDLAKLAQAENPFEELRRIVLDGQRVWTAVPLDVGGALPMLPAQPLAAQRESVTLNLGMMRIHFFASRQVRLWTIACWTHPERNCCEERQRTMSSVSPCRKSGCGAARIPACIRCFFTAAGSGSRSPWASGRSALIGVWSGSMARPSNSGASTGMTAIRFSGQRWGSPR